MAPAWVAGVPQRRHAPVLLALLLVAGLLWLLRDDTPPTPGPGPGPGPDGTTHPGDPALASAGAPAAAPAGPSLRARPPRVPAPDTEPETTPTRTIRVVDRRGDPLAGAGVAWWSEPPPQIHRGHRARQSDRRARATTDAHGRVRLPADVPSSVHIGVRHRDYVWFEGPLALQGDEMQIVLEPDVRVTGHLEDDRGRAIVGAWIHAYDARPRAEQRADWEKRRPPFLPPGAGPDFDRELGVTKTVHGGGWHLRLREGRVRLVMHLASGATIERVMDVDARDENHWHLRLERGLVLHVTVEPPPGAEHLDFDVQLFTGLADGSLDVKDGYQVNDPTGPGFPTASLDLPPAGTPYYVVFFCANEAVPCHIVGPMRGARSELRVRLPDDAHRHGMLRGRLPKGSYKADLWAAVTDAHGFEAEVMVGDDETFEAKGLPPGRYTVRIETQDDTVLWQRTDLRVRAGTTTHVEGIEVAVPNTEVDEDD